MFLVDKVGYAGTLQAFADYEDMMEITEGLIEECAQRVAGGLSLSYQGRPLDLAAPFRRSSMHDLLAETLGTARRPAT
jgi:lysyl-tRNA synthetase, class II